MSSAIIIPDIPPFRGGPLQPRSAPNNAAADRFLELKDTFDPVQTKITATSTAASRDRQRERSNTRSRPAASLPPPSKPNTRLEREGKKDHYGDPQSIGPWTLGKIIGQGCSGRVRLAKHSQSGQSAAVKIVGKAALTASRMNLHNDKPSLGVEREIVIMKLIEHPNLLGLWDVYETKKELFLVMEHVAGGELFDHLTEHGCFSPRQARSYFRQIIFGVDYCHRFNICHRDLKPENLLLDSTKRIVKVADFGMAKVQPSERLLETACGSPHYASPEIVKGESYDGTTSDIWSCGIILYVLLVGRLPFDDPEIPKVLRLIKHGDFYMPDHLDPTAKDLLWRMLEVNPSRRITLAALMRHPWFTNHGREASANPVSINLHNLGSEKMELEHLDPEIVGNLATLWPEKSKAELVEQLLIRGPNWQKTFYSLLATHRDNHTGDNEDAEDDPTTRPVEERAKAASLVRDAPCSGSSNPLGGRARSRPPTDRIVLSAASASMKCASRHQEPRQSPTPDRHAPAIPQRGGPTLVAHAGAPPSSPVALNRRATQSRTRACAVVDAMPASRNWIDLDSTLSGTQANLTRRTTSPSIKSESSNIARAIKAHASVDVQLPQDHSRPIGTGSNLKQRSGGQQSQRVGAPSRKPRPASVHGTAMANPGTSTASGASPMLHTALVGNDAVHTLFQEIVDGMASMRPLGRGPAHNFGHRQEGTCTPTLNADSDGNQFADADEDFEGSTADTGHGTENQSLSADGKTAATKKAPMAPAIRSAPHSPQTRISIDDNHFTQGDRPSRPVSLFSNATSRPVANNDAASTRARSLLRGSPVVRQSVRQGWQTSGVVVADSSVALRYEDTNAGVASRVVEGSVNGVAAVRLKNPDLGLNILQPQDEFLHVGNVGRTRNIGSSSPGGSSYGSRSPSLSGAPASPIPKQSWFSGLFNWKPAQHTLLSTKPIDIVTKEVRRLLTSYGVTVILEDSENAGVLKCSVVELRDDDATGYGSGIPPTRLTRFKIHFTSLPVASTAPSPQLGYGGASSTHGSLQSSSKYSAMLPSPALSQHSRASTDSRTVVYATSVLLVQEKGPLSVFKQALHCLRRDWALEAARGVEEPTIRPVGLGFTM